MVGLPPLVLPRTFGYGDEPGTEANVSRPKAKAVSKPKGSTPKEKTKGQNLVPPAESAKAKGGRASAKADLQRKAESAAAAAAKPTEPTDDGSEREEDGDTGSEDDAPAGEPAPIDAEEAEEEIIEAAAEVMDRGRQAEDEQRRPHAARPDAAVSA
jgi:hypothetical protein